MKKLYILSIFLVLYSFSFGQQFQISAATDIPVTVNSQLLQNPWVGGINYPEWSEIDLNGDGIMDLIDYEGGNNGINRLSPFINDGTTSGHPYHYAPEYMSKFPKMVQAGWMKTYDYNCDGKMDLFVLDSLRTGISVYRNDYTVGTGLQFTRVAFSIMETSPSNGTPFALFASATLVPTLIDMDNDGDVDILGFNSVPNGKLTYHRNYSMEHYGTCDSLDFRFETQCWGDFMLCLGTNDVCTYNDSCPLPVAPPQGYEVARKDDTIATLFAIDLDGDGAKEVLIGDQAYPTSLMVHNGGTPAYAIANSKDSIFPSYDVPINVNYFVTHAYLDVDNDGKRDLLASAGVLEDKNGVWLYKNNGTNASPVFNFQKENFMQEEMLDVGQAAVPVFFDYDADGLKDLIVGHGAFRASDGAIAAQLSVFKNVGTATQPAFQYVTDDYDSISLLGLQTPITPAFGDIDGDGDADLIIGDNTGKLYYFNNSAGAGNPANFQFASFPYMNIDIGNAASPQIIDLNRDGLPDLLVGEQNGTLNYFQNTGIASSAFFTAAPTIDTLGFVNVQSTGSQNGFSVPYVFQDSGHYVMLVSNMHGDVFLYNNIDGNLNGAFTRISTLLTDSIGLRVSGFNVAATGGDINGDGLEDLAVGLFSGGVKIFYQTNTTGIGEVNSEPQLFEAYPNPANNLLNIKVLERLFDKDLKIRLYNSLGEKVLAESLSSNSAIINTGIFSAGTYFVQVISGTTSRFQRIIISH